jgi:hypothetical protein
VIAVPKSRAGTGIKLAVVNLEAVDVPKGVFPPETTVFSLNIRAFLYGTLAFAYCHLLQSQTMSLEERALTLEVLTTYYLHSF